MRQGTSRSAAPSASCSARSACVRPANIITRTTHGGAPVVRGTGYAVNAVTCVRLTRGLPARSPSSSPASRATYSSLRHRSEKRTCSVSRTPIQRSVQSATACGSLRRSGRGRRGTSADVRSAWSRRARRSASSASRCAAPSHGRLSHYVTVLIQTCSTIHTITAVF
jgi:hypothetical protein